MSNIIVPQASRQGAWGENPPTLATNIAGIKPQLARITNTSEVIISQLVDALATLSVCHRRKIIIKLIPIRLVQWEGLSKQTTITTNFIFWKSYCHQHFANLSVIVLLSLKLYLALLLQSKVKWKNFSKLKDYEHNRY